MTKHPFPHHRQAALALLGEHSDLPHKTAGFLGHVCVATELTGAQRNWLEKLLERYGYPPLESGVAQ
jgi:hypothetical protein